MQVEGPVYMQYIYANDIASMIVQNCNGLTTNENNIFVVSLLNAVAKLGYKITVLNENDFDVQDGTSVVHKAYKYAVGNMYNENHLSYQDYLNMIPETDYDKDEEIMQAGIEVQVPCTSPFGNSESVVHISKEAYDKQLEYHAKVLGDFITEINSYKSLNKESS